MAQKRATPEASKVRAVSIVLPTESGSAQPATPPEPQPQQPPLRRTQVNLYSASSLAGPWRSHGTVIHGSQLPASPRFGKGPFALHRPRVLANSAPGDPKAAFVLWLHFAAKVGRGLTT